jgi:hypothetical protein
MGRVYGDCRTCGSPITTARAKRCDKCRELHPDRHTGRRKPQMFVSIDGEGSQNDPVTGVKGERMRLITLSFGREDGSSETWRAGRWDTDQNAAQNAIKWLIDRVTRDYVDADGVAYKQVPVAFHFNWDASTISTYFNPKQMLLVHKAIARETNLLCDTVHVEWHEPCEKPYHRRSIPDINAVITDGGEGDVLAWDSLSRLAITATPRRRFYAELRPRGDQYADRSAVLDIHDTGTAFVGGLLTAIAKWKPELTPAQHDVIEWGKKHRSGGQIFAGDLAKVAEYSEAECVAHARMCRQLINAVKDVAHFEMRPHQLFGSGSVAAAAFKSHGVPTREETQVCETVVSGVQIDMVAWLDYFGGLIETPVVGLVAGHVDELDLNSAYPAQMIHLPCMRDGHGQWRKARGHVDLPAHTVGHALVSWIVDTPSTPPFLVRDSDACVYAPLTGSKIWTTLPEYQAGIAQFPRDIITHHTVWWEQECECEPPLLWIGELYARRQELKTAMAEMEKLSGGWKDAAGDLRREWVVEHGSAYQDLKCLDEAIKLVINSCYGKLAQRRPDLGRYTNLHFAAMITGATRALVRQETWKRETETDVPGREPGVPVYQHTDSVLSIGGDPVDGGATLGAWAIERKPTEDFVIVQPGQATSSVSTGKRATRGVREGDFMEAVERWRTVVDFTTHPTTWPAIEIEQDRMYSRRLAAAQGKPHLAGSFLPTPMKLTVGTTQKRNIADAYQISTRAPAPGMPDRRTAWIVPPLFKVDEPVRDPEDIKAFQRKLTEATRSGAFDCEMSDAMMTAGMWELSDELGEIGEPDLFDPSELTDLELFEPSELIDADEL